MGYMSASHLYRVYTDYLGWHLDFTGAPCGLCVRCAMFVRLTGLPKKNRAGPQMLLTQSLTALAFQLHDGRRLAKGTEFVDNFMCGFRSL